MTLSVVAAGDRRNPALVLLHGFLGSSADWKPVVSLLERQFYCICIDLPGHGASMATSLDRVSGLDDCCSLVDDSVRDIDVKRFWLAGYSLGGRIAMHYVCRYAEERRQESGHGYSEQVSGLILESAHPGLESESEREARRHHDRRWAFRMRSEPLINVLNDWYCQPVFADLPPAERQTMISQRQKNNSATLADMLEATSLSRQAYLGNALRCQTIPVLYLCGGRDDRFHMIGKQLRECSGVDLVVQKQAGHNVHSVCPAFFTASILSFFSSHHGTTEFDDE